MRIGIDYTAAIRQGAGIGRYTRELVRAIIEQGQGFSFRLFYAALGVDPANPYLAQLRQLCAAYPHVRPAPIPLPERRLTQLWHRLRIPLPIELFTGPLDILHATDFVPPPTRARTIVTIHDLSFIVHPECALPSVARYLNDAVPRGLKRANTLLADSEATRQDLVRYMAVDPGRIKVLYPGVGPQFRPMPAAEIEPERHRLGLPRHFLLFVSTIEPRKNLVRLLEAFALLIRQQTSESESNSRVVSSVEPARTAPMPLAGNPVSELHLVIGGRKGWLYEDVFQAIERHGLHERVRLLDYVDDKDLPTLYNLAYAFVYPSIYEGFGFPALEAMACGTPVLTANNSSLPEVVGDVAVLVQAEDTRSIVDGLRRIVSDTALRTRLQEAGPQRAGLFRWERAAQEVLALYRAQAG